LRNDHRRRREEDSEGSERAGTGKKQVYDKADHDRREAHECVDQDRQRAPSRKLADGDRGAQRQPDARRDHRCGEADAQGQLDDGGEPGVEMRYEARRDGQAVGEGIQSAGSCKKCIMGAILCNLYEAPAKEYPWTVTAEVR